MARPARPSPAPSVAHSSSSAQEHPSTGPRALASPAPSTIDNGKGQHAPSLTESAGAFTESARALTVSAPLLMQPEDGGYQAAASLIPASGGHPAPRRPRASRDPRRPRPPRPHRARQTRSSSVTAVAQLAGYLAPRRRRRQRRRAESVRRVLPRRRTPHPLLISAGHVGSLRKFY